MTIKISKIIYLIIISVIIFSCARVVAPTGGEKDETEPLVLESKPHNYSTNFKEDKIMVTFDEYVTLQSISQELIMSPLQDEKPEAKLRGKSIVIKINDTLENNVTYNLNFYNAIQDLNEGNVLKNYQYVFSTGPVIDTLFIIGHVYNAFNLEFEKDVFVMLYNDYADTIPITQEPYYLTKTGEDGSFVINNVKPGTYKVFALNDANRNFKFDQPGEAIAFVDSLITPKVKLEDIMDTVQVFHEEDSTYYDSTFLTTYVVPAIKELHLMMFTEDFENQFIQESSRKDQKSLDIIFNRRLERELKIEPVNFETKDDWFVYESNPSQDSIRLWITDTTIYKKDSVVVSLDYDMRDSNEVWIPTIDTINFLFIPKTVEAEKKKKKKKNEIDTIKVIKPSELKVKMNVKNNSEFDLARHLTINFNYPIKEIDTSFIDLYFVEDTIETPLTYNIIKDSIKNRTYYFDTEFKTEESYKFVADSGAFIDVYGNIGDSIGAAFRIKAEEKYGKIQMTLEDNEIPGIIQLLDEKENIVAQNIITSIDTVVEFLYLPPKAFLVKYIHDKNGNKEWDTGDYLEKLQPEEVFYYESEIKVKENWEYEFNWNIRENQDTQVSDSLYYRYDINHKER